MSVNKNEALSSSGDQCVDEEHKDLETTVKRSDGAEGTLGGGDSTSEGASSLLPQNTRPDSPLTLQCEGGQGKTYILHANSIAINITDPQVVQVGNNNKVILENEVLGEKNSELSGTGGLTLQITHRKPDAGKQVLNGQSRTRALDKDTDPSVELAVFRGGEQDRRILASGSEYDVFASVDREPLDGRDGAAKWTAENSCICERVRPLRAGTCLFLFRFFGPKSKFRVTFNLVRKRQQSSSKYDYLDMQETCWEEVCQTSIELENKEERKKTRKTREKQQRPGMLGGDLVTDAARLPVMKAYAGNVNPKRSAFGYSACESSDDESPPAQTRRHQPRPRDSVTDPALPAMNGRSGNQFRKRIAFRDHSSKSSDEKNSFEQAIQHHRARTSSDLVTDAPLLAQASRAIPSDMNVCSGNLIRNRSAFNHCVESSDEEDAASHSHVGQDTSRAMEEISRGRTHPALQNVRGEDVTAYGNRMREEGALGQIVPLLKPTGQCKTKKCNLIMGKLAVLQDNGEWDVFDQVTRDLLKRFGHGKKDIECVINIEQGVKLYYQNQLDDSGVTFRSVIALTERTDNPELLRGRAYFLLANVYREQKLLGLAEECLRLSLQNLVQVKSDEDRAELYYNYGNFLMECLNIAAKPSREMVLMAKEYFKKELDVASQTPDERVRVKKQQYALLKIAFLLLDCRNQLGRTRAVCSEDVLEAKVCLDKIENELWDSVAKGTEIQFNLARSDQFYRLGNYKRALGLAKTALQNIQTYQFNTQASKAEERIRHLQGLVQEDQMQYMSVDSILAEIQQSSEADLASVDTEEGQDNVNVHDPNCAF